jgi:5-methylcytosine-specific restriction protein A
MATAVKCKYQGKAISVSEALRIKQQSPSEVFACVECGQLVRPHRSGGNTKAHFEHLDRNPSCTLSHISRGETSGDNDAVGGEDWSNAELKAAVEAYVSMQRKHLAGEVFVKKSTYEKLSSRFGRTAKSFEYRMQNISYVYSLMGRKWLPGLKPAKNVGARVAAVIERLIGEVEGRMTVPTVEFDIRVREEAKRKQKVEPPGNQKPSVTTAEVTQYKRDPAVKAWILECAKGVCECCLKPAPFLGVDEEPFLEVHHVIQLADLGPDTICNAVALCPNCHRQIHYGKEAQSVVAKLYATIHRLRK